MAARGLGYLPSVDGLRAVAVAAVVAFHLAPGALPGGFLGVDTFFVVSGYLITALLLAEHASTGGIALRAFWARRARRLLPALLLVLTAVAVAAAVWWPAADLARVRGDALAGLGYVANWRFVATGDSYFDLASGPSPLRHLWSLAIEEQFYVVWPLVALACLRRSPRLLGWVAGAGAAASVAALVAAGGAADPSRAYYGTDTRAHALLVGAALAVVLRHRRAAPPRWLAPAGAVALVLCAASWWLAGESSRWLYRWGFPAYALLTAVVVASVVRAEGGRLARLLSIGPLVALGKVSYGLYLWHWPAIVLLTERRTGLDGVSLGALRLGVAVAGTLASYWLLEQPVRFGRRFRGRPALFTAGGAVGTTVAAVLVATAGATGVPDYLRAPGAADAPRASLSVNTVPAAAVVERSPAPAAVRHPSSVVLVGDSVAWTFREQLGAALGARGVPFASAAIVGCGAAVSIADDGVLVTDDDGAIHPWSESCRSTTQQVQRDALAAVSPDLVLFHSSWETSDRQVDGDWLRFGTPAWDAEVRRELRGAVDALTARGTRLAVLTQPPLVAGDLRPVDPDEQARRAHYNDLLEELVRDERVLLVDFAGLVCGGTVDACPEAVDGVRLRPLDGSHFEADGAAWIGEHLAELVLQLDLGPAPQRRFSPVGATGPG